MVEIPGNSTHVYVNYVISIILVNNIGFVMQYNLFHLKLKNLSTTLSEDFWYSSDISEHLLCAIIIIIMHNIIMQK